MSFSIVVAIAQNDVIGLNGTIPWHLRSDLQRFKKITLNSCVIMGRATWESLPAPLQDRTNIILTRDKTYKTSASKSFVANDLEQAKNIAQAMNVFREEIFVIGGVEIYNLFLTQNLVDKLYVTWILDKPKGDRYFKLNLNNWREVYRETLEKSGKDSSASIFAIYEKLK